MRYLHATFILGLSVATLLLSPVSLWADSTPSSSDLDVKVSLPSSQDDINFVANFTAAHPEAQLTNPVVIHLTNNSRLPIYLPNFNLGFAPLTVTCASTSAKVVDSDLPFTQPEIVTIQPSASCTAIRDLHSLLRFTVAGTYEVNYTFDCSYTFHELKDLNTSPDTYTSHEVTQKGTLEVYISPGKSTWGWAIIAGPAALVLLIICYFLFSGSSAKQGDSGPKEITLSDRLDSEDK